MDLSKSTIQISCFPHLTPWLQREVEALGYSVESARATGVEITGSMRDAMRLNLHLRAALNVLYLLDKFDCVNADELYDYVSSMAWEELISPFEYLTVVTRADTPSIDNSMYPSLKVKDAIVDRMARKTGRRPDSGPERDCLVFNLFWKGNHCWLYLNTSGQKISDRDYRKMPHTAPLRETLAAGILMATGYSGDAPLVAPMCGSGTLATEGALIGLRRAPGLLRNNFGFMHVLGYDKGEWEKLRQEALGAARETLPAPVIASDIDPAAVNAAKTNAKAAGLDHLIEFHVCDFAETPIPSGKGIVVMNPEYGMRLGEVSALAKTYERIGDFLKQKCQGYTGYVFTGNPELASKIALRPSRKLPFLNAKIECRLLEYQIFSGGGKKDVKA